jgi:hypothetical protein
VDIKGGRHKMARNSKKNINIDEIRALAAEYGVSDNPLFESTLSNYETVQKAISMIRKTLDDDEMTITKEYVKGRENTYLHPAVKELPKQVDIANKTMDTLIKIIAQFGNANSKDELMDFLGRGRK